MTRLMALSLRRRPMPEGTNHVFLHRAQGNPKPLGDARVGQAIETAEQKHLLVAAWQAAQAFEELLLLLPFFCLLPVEAVAWQAHGTDQLQQAVLLAQVKR